MGKSTRLQEQACEQEASSDSHRGRSGLAWRGLRAACGTAQPETAKLRRVQVAQDSRQGCFWQGMFTEIKVLTPL